MMVKDEKLCKLAIDTVQNLVSEGYMEQIKICDEMIKNNSDPKDIDFYQTQQDQLNQAYGEILIAYYNLKAELKTYIAIRKTTKRMEAIAENKKIPGDAFLEDGALAEIDELYKAVIILEGWVERGSNSIKTARSHSYGSVNERLVKNEEKEIA